MKRLVWALLFSMLIESSAFAMFECGVEWNTSLSRRMGVSPQRVMAIKDAIEVEPNHWVSNSPQGGSIYVNFGQDVGERFAKSFSDLFFWDRAIVTKNLIDQWKIDNAPLSFRYKIDVSWSFRALPAHAPSLSWVPGQRHFAAATNLGCRTNAGWQDPDGKSWSSEIQTVKGLAGYKAWLKQWGMRPDKIIENANVNQWYPFSEGYTVDFDPAFCNTHLGAALEIKEFRELYLVDWKFDIYETTNPEAINPCP